MKRRDNKREIESKRKIIEEIKNEDILFQTLTKRIYHFGGFASFAFYIIYENLFQLKILFLLYVFCYFPNEQLKKNESVSLLYIWKDDKKK